MRHYNLEIYVWQVSWVRSRDLQILAYEGQVFTADSRVSLAQSSGAHTQTHALTIARLRDSDTGRYECQLNTDPKMSLFFNLSVVGLYIINFNLFMTYLANLFSITNITHVTQVIRVTYQCHYPS